MAFNFEEISQFFLTKATRNAMKQLTPYLLTRLLGVHVWPSLASTLRYCSLSAGLLLVTAGCKKATDTPFADCRSNGGIASTRSVMFWTAQDPKCGPVSLISMRDTETNASAIPYTPYGTITYYFTTQPACGTKGTISVEVPRGYEYEYTLSCTGRQWTGKVKVGCGNDCVPVQLQ